jgi:hypothetical protein
MLFNVNPAEHQCLGIAEIKPVNFSIARNVLDQKSPHYYAGF